MGSLSFNQFWIHGSNHVSGTGNPAISLELGISGKGNSQTGVASVEFWASLNSMGTGSTFNYAINIYAGSKDDSHLLFSKPATNKGGPSTWSSGEYSGIKTLDLNIPSGSTTVPIYIVFSSAYDSSDAYGCGCSGFASGHKFFVGDLQVLKSGSPSAPTKCSVSKTEVLVGGKFNIDYDGSSCEYRLRDIDGNWSNWYNFYGSSYTIPEDFTVTAVQFRSRNIDYEYVSPYSSYVTSKIVYSKLTAPRKPTLSSNPVVLGNSVTAKSTHLSEEVSGIVVAPATINYRWYSSDGSQVSTSKTYTPEVSGYYCKTFASLANFVSSDYSTVSESVEVVCPVPSNLGFSPNPVVVGNSATLSCTVDSRCSAEYNISRDGGSSWTSSTESFRITNSTCTFRARSTKEGCTSSGWINLGSNIPAKLPAPSVSVSPSPVTVEQSVSLTCTSEDFPSATPEFQYSRGSSLATCTSPFKIMNSGYKFRVRISMSGYVTSDWSSWSSEVVVYFEPRDMSSKGFSPTFSIDSSETPFVVSGTEVTVSWGEFRPALNLGRFNYYVLDLVCFDGFSDWNVVETVKGTNSPLDTSVTSGSIILDEDKTLGQKCKLRLSCQYIDSSGNLYGPQESAQFFSKEYYISGYPAQPETLYPSGQNFTSCNLKPRIIFKVSNPSYLEDTNIYDVRVSISSNSGTAEYTLSSNPEYFCTKDGPASLPLSSGSVLVFTPESSEEQRTFRIYSTNAYLENKRPTVVVCSYDSLPYAKKGEVLRKTQKDHLVDRVKGTLKDYEKILTISLPEQENAGPDYVVKSLFVSLIEVLRQTYETVVSQYAPRPENEIDLGEVNTTADKPPVIADRSNFVVTLGNYFNDVLYVLKSML